MAAKIYYENEAPIAPLQGKKVAVIGYGSQGHAHSEQPQGLGRHGRRRPALGLGQLGQGREGRAHRQAGR